MKIKTYLILSTSILTGLIVLLSVALFFYLAKIKEASQESQAASLLLKEVAELALVTDDYLAYKYERSLQQWEIKYGRINDVLANNPSVLKKIDTDIKFLAQSFRILQESFENKKLTADINVSDWMKARTSILRERAQGSVKLYSNRVFTNTFKISQDAMEHVNRLQKNASTLFVGFAIFLISAVSFTYYMIIRKIATPMKALITGTTIIGNGELTYQIPLKQYARDEFKQLIEQFNLMAVKLLQSGASLRESEAKYRQIYENIQDVYYEASIEGQILEVSPSIRNISQYTQKDLIGKSLYDIYANPGERDKFIQSIMENQKVNDFEIIMIDKNGSPVNCSIVSTLVKDETGKPIKIVGSMRDITDRKLAEEKIKASLKEKEVLLQEIHHRVKNNMQIIISLLKLQANKITDKQYANMFQDSQDRIKTMSLIHEQLYQTKNFADIDFGEHVESLVNGLFDSYGIDTNKVKLNIDIKDVSFDIENAIPCGLIINELVSNSLKHAFPQDRTRQAKLWEPPASANHLPMIISIALQSINEDDLELTVSDDGIGIPEDLDIGKTDTMGLHLVKVLAEQQLDGKLDLDRTEGTQFKIKFKRTAYKPRI